MTQFKRRSDSVLGELLDTRLGHPKKDNRQLTPLERRFVDLQARYAGKKQELAEANAANEELSKLAYFDDLTKLANRRLLQISFDEAVNRKEQIVLVYIDLKLFKQTNDTHGHAVGDMVLARVGNELAAITRSTDLIAHTPEHEQKHLAARDGGDEFTILFTGANLSDLGKKVEKIREIFSTLSLSVDENTNIPIRASIGAYERQEGEDLDHCKAQADKEMYKNKKNSNLVDTSRMPFAKPIKGYFMPSSDVIPSTTNYSYIADVLKLAP